MRSVTYTYLIVLLILGFIAITNLAPGASQVRAESASPSEVGILKEDVEHIKTDLAEIKKQLVDIRRLLSQRPAQAQRPGNVVAKVSTADNPSLGKPDAPVTIIEFSDYECPFCRRFFQNTLPALKTDYVDTGKARYVFRDFPLDRIHPHARKAAEAAHCAGDQSKYWEMHDRLFQNGALGIINLKGYARDLGLDLAVFEACLDEGKYAAEVDKDAADGAASGVTGTPSFFIGKTGSDGTIEGTLIRGAQAITAFKQEIDRLLKTESQPSAAEVKTQ
jgi:protein-disulfide isomerase